MLIQIYYINENIITPESIRLRHFFLIRIGYRLRDFFFFSFFFFFFPEILQQIFSRIFSLLAFSSDDKQ